MRYTILPHGSGGTYSITFVVENKEDHRVMHDQVATRIAEPSKFVAEVFCAGHEKAPQPSRGVVPLVK